MATANPLRSGRKFKDISGQIFRHLTALRCVERGAHGAIWLCRCDCGRPRCPRECRILGYRLLSGRVWRCNGRRSKTEGNRGNTKHGGWDSPEWHTWEGIIRRCHDPASTTYHRYGAKGVTVCARWRDSFANFLADMGTKPTPRHTIDRIDNSRGYEPGNCRWATAKEQACNRRNNRLVTFNGRTMPLALWAQEIGISKELLHYRIGQASWFLEQALTTPKGVARTA